MSAATESVLVTGAAGFLGSHLVRALLSDDRYHALQILALDDLSGGFQENLPESSRVSFLPISITDAAAVDRVFDEHRIRFVFHLAAYAAEGLSHFIKRFNYTNNLIGSINLINAAVNHAVKCFVFTSSIAVYGAGQTPMTESMIPLPEDSYGISKLAVERELHVTHEMF